MSSSISAETRQPPGPPAQLPDLSLCCVLERIVCTFCPCLDANDVHLDGNERTNWAFFFSCGDWTQHKRERNECGKAEPPLSLLVKAAAGRARHY